MSVFEWLQSCSLEEFAEWLVEFQDQCEENVIRQFTAAGLKITRVSMAKEILCARAVNDLSEEHP